MWPSGSLGWAAAGRQVVAAMIMACPAAAGSSVRCTDVGSGVWCGVHAAARNRRGSRDGVENGWMELGIGLNT